MYYVICTIVDNIWLNILPSKCFALNLSKGKQLKYSVQWCNQFDNPRE